MLTGLPLTGLPLTGLPLTGLPLTGLPLRPPTTMLPPWRRRGATG